MTVTDEQQNQAACASASNEPEEEQVVNIEHVEAKDNKGIDYDKLISMFTPF